MKNERVGRRTKDARALSFVKTIFLDTIVLKRSSNKRQSGNRWLINVSRNYFNISIP